MAREQLSGYQRFMSPILDALRELGGSAKSAQVKDTVIRKMNISDAELAETLANGVSKIGNQIDWARFYLAKADYLDSSKRGVWALTEKGKSAQLSAEVVRQIARDVNRGERDASPQPNEEQSDTPQQQDHRGHLLAVIKSLPPAGFEELCRYLLLESGFEQVNVTGRSGDGGIDGHGILRVNKLVSMTVLFQCKRYSDAVSTGVVRDFRGALAGRAEKGIIITTGYYTNAAELEATRDGVVPIELVDGDRLVELFESLEIGLKNPRTVYEVDEPFFERFRAPTSAPIGSKSKRPG